MVMNKIKLQLLTYQLLLEVSTKLSLNPFKLRKITWRDFYQKNHYVYLKNKRLTNELINTLLNFQKVQFEYLRKQGFWHVNVPVFLNIEDSQDIHMFTITDVINLILKTWKEWLLSLVKKF